MNRTVTALLSVAATLILATSASAHCEIPCGIYGDEARFSSMFEHVTTIEKSMKLIRQLSGEEEKNFNQIARWVANKDKHADDLREIVVDYFLAQRVKVADSNDEKAHKRYLERLVLLHGIIVRSMKAKQTTDHEHVDALKELIHLFKDSYFEK